MHNGAIVSTGVMIATVATGDIFDTGASVVIVAIIDIVTTVPYTRNWV